MQICNQRFFPLEISFNNFFNTYFVTSVSVSFAFRAFQPKFYEFIKIRTLSMSSGFNLQQYVLFTSFQNPSNLFRPSLFSPFLQKSELFKNDRITLSLFTRTFFQYPIRPFFFNFSNNFLYFRQFFLFYPYKYFFTNIFFRNESFYTVKFNFPKILLSAPHHFTNLQIFSFLPIKLKKRTFLKQTFFFVPQTTRSNRKLTHTFNICQTLYFYISNSNFTYKSKFFNFYFSSVVKANKIFSINKFFTFDDLYFSIFTPFTQLGVSKFYDQIFLLKRFNRKFRYNAQIPIFKFKNFSNDFLILKRLGLITKYLN